MITYCHLGALGDPKVLKTAMPALVGEIHKVPENC